MIYFDMSACQYFDIPYYNAGDFHVSKDAYRRVMGAKLDQYALWMKKGVVKREGIGDIWVPD